MIDGASVESVLCSSHNTAPQFDSVQLFVGCLLVSVLGGVLCPFFVLAGSGAGCASLA